jgi:hypothetical protein
MALQPISLYLELEPGQKVDLVAAASASIAFADAIHEIAYILDPSIEVRIELSSGTEGSLSINSIIRSLKEKATDPEILRTIVVVITLWLAKEGLSWGYHELLGKIFGPHEITLSDADAKKIAEKVKQMLDSGVAKPQVQRIYRDLERDPAVKGVGVSTKPGTRPHEIVPRSEFSTRGGYQTLEETTIHRREKTDRETVTLISPVLLPGTRRWRFSSREGEFGAPIQDETFLENLLSGTTAIPMVAGITMEVDLQTIEEKREDGVWEAVERNILRVHTVTPALRQSSLPFPRPRPTKANKRKKKPKRT